MTGERRSGVLTHLEYGQVKRGVVTRIENFGIFVDIGGVEGMVNVAEASWSHIDGLEQVTAVGEVLSVVVLDVDHDRDRVSLSLKWLQEDPWIPFSRAMLGKRVTGIVTRHVPFGVFVRVTEGIEGLLHDDDLARHGIERPRPGTEIPVTIADINLVGRRVVCAAAGPGATTR